MIAAAPRAWRSGRSCAAESTAAAADKYEQLVAHQKHELERVASLTADEAKELLIRQIESEARHDSANLLKRLDAEARESAVDRAKQYITEAIQRCGAEHAIETTVSVVDLPSDGGQVLALHCGGPEVPEHDGRHPHRLEALAAHVTDQ